MPAVALGPAACHSRWGRPCSYSHARTSAGPRRRRAGGRADAGAGAQHVPRALGCATASRRSCCRCRLQAAASSLPRRRVAAPRRPRRRRRPVGPVDCVGQDVLGAVRGCAAAQHWRQSARRSQRGGQGGQRGGQAQRCAGCATRRGACQRPSCLQLTLPPSVAPGRRLSQTPGSRVWMWCKARTRPVRCRAERHACAGGRKGTHATPAAALRCPHEPAALPSPPLHPPNPLGLQTSPTMKWTTTHSRRSGWTWPPCPSASLSLWCAAVAAVWGAGRGRRCCRQDQSRHCCRWGRGRRCCRRAPTHSPVLRCEPPLARLPHTCLGLCRSAGTLL